MKYKNGYRYGQLFRFEGHLVDADEAQEMVDCANYLILIHSAVLYGLIETDMEINIERCVAVVERGKQLGFIPDENIEKFIE